MTTGPDRVRPDRDAALMLADPATTEDVAACERPLFDVFAELAARHPDHLAVDDGAARLSYEELRDRALALGARVAAVVPVDGLVGVLVPTGVLYPVAWLACLAARRPFLPLDPHVPSARTQAIIAEAGLAAVIVPTTATDFSARLPAGLARIPMAGELEPEPAPLPKGLPPAKVGMVLFTSGSTGRAKGIALHERSQLRKAINYHAACALGPGDRLLSLHPPSTNGGAGDTLGALLCGASLHMVDLKRAGLAGVQAVLRGGITVCATVPVVMRTLMAMDGAAEALRHVRVLRLGGDTVMGSDVAGLARVLAPTARILVRFGMTESGATLAQRLVDPRAPVESGPLALDTAVPGQTISVEDAAGEQVAPGEAGELVIRGRYVALGHWFGGKLDAAAFPADPSAPGARCYRTGDMVLLRADGMLIPVGRTDRQVKINGTRVEPNETEAALRELSGVMDAAVLVDGDASAPMLVAFVVPAAREHATKPSAQTAAQLARGWRATLVALLPPQQVPAQIRVVPAIPLLPSLKPDLGALRALLATENAPGLLGRVWTRLRGGGSRGPAARISADGPPRWSRAVTTGLPDTAPAEDTAAFEGPLFDAFAAVVARQPDHLAVDDGVVRFSYAELCDRALALGARVAAVVPADGLVGVLVPTDALCPVAWLACLAARRPFLPFDPHLPPARNQAIIAEAGLAAAIVPATMADGAAWLPADLPRMSVMQAPGPEPARLSLGRPAGDVGMVLFTSGSTGRPKGIALHERSVLRRAMHDRMTCDLGPDDRLLSLHPPPTSAGARDVLGALLSGASLHLVDLKRDGLAQALARLRTDSITICAAVPVVVRAMLAMDGVAGALRSLRIMRLSGDAVMGSDIAALARLLPPPARVLLTFGMTEAGVLLERMIDPGSPVETGRIAAGTPVPGQRVSVEDATGNPVGPGETGTLVIRGRYLALGHWVAGGLDTAAFPPDPSVPWDRCYRSGDVVLLRADGMLVPIGRADRQVKINGLRVEPGDAEAALRSLSGVADAAVLAHGPAGTPVLVAFAVPVPSRQSARDAARLARGWRAALAALLPPQLVPARILVVPAIPLLPSLKPDLSALRALLSEQEVTRGVLGRTWTRLRGARLSVLAECVQLEVWHDDSVP